MEIEKDRNREKQIGRQKDGGEGGREKRGEGKRGNVKKRDAG